MEGCNPVPLDRLTEEELSNLEGAEEGQLIYVGGELHYLMKRGDEWYLSPHWD
jgi:hypothetical protein